MHREILYGRYFSVARASLEDIPVIAACICEPDRLELSRMSDEPPERILIRSLEEARYAWTAFAPDDTPVAMWGVTDHPTVPHIGIPWLIKTDRALEKLSDFLWLSKYYDRLMGQRYNILGNFVDTEYVETLRWLNRLGYQQLHNHLIYPKGHPFVFMYRNTNVQR